MSETTETTMVTKIWDKIGVCASGLCLVHCLATPFLILLFPATKIDFLETYHFHEIFAVLVTSSILLALYPHCKKHGHTDIILIAAVGVAFVIGGIVFPQLPETLHVASTVIGSIFLITAHIKNMKVRHGKCETESNCSH